MMTASMSSLSQLRPEGSLALAGRSSSCRAPRGCFRVQAATTEAATTSNSPGFRYDPSMQRWVKDDRFAGAKHSTVITPMSGTPYTIWPVMHTELVRRRVRPITPEDALQAVESGRSILLDVRLAKQYDRGHAEHATNVPLYRITAGNSGWDRLKRTVMAGLVMDPTERDPDFAEHVLEALGKGAHGKHIIVMCGVGGTLDTKVHVASTGKTSHNDPDRAFGRESRCLKAAYELLQAKFSKVDYLEGGYNTWRHHGLP